MKTQHGSLPVGSLPPRRSESGHLINSRGNVAFLHQLKCWAESFDAIASGEKRAEVRMEDDRKFLSGDVLELTRTDRDGKATEPPTWIVIEVLHVERYAGPLELRGARAEEGGAEQGGTTTPIAVLSLAHRFEKHTYEAPKVDPAGNAREQKGAP